MSNLNSFSFKKQELVSQILTAIQSSQNGYWQFNLGNSTHPHPQAAYLGINDSGTLCYAGRHRLSGESFLRTIKRFNLSARQEKYKSYFSEWAANLQQDSVSICTVMTDMLLKRIITPKELRQALKQKILLQMDHLLAAEQGNAHFFPDAQLDSIDPLLGFSGHEIVSEGLVRQKKWELIKPLILSMDGIPIVNTKILNQTDLPPLHRKWLDRISRHEKSLEQISVAMGKDPLEVASLFAQWVQLELVEIERPMQSDCAPVMIIDDSQLLIKQFDHLVRALGHQVIACQESEKAVDKIHKVNPSMVFIDINMPGITGFELVKQIRQQSRIASIPLVILTGEQKLSNKWRAQWSGCEFLTKPLGISEIKSFQSQLKDLIQQFVEGEQHLAAA
ncbi:response regulator [Acaryochloris sp. IP29b_bin.137]|uniref:response regulator n=1 Tax=Acaryochloris sp. IP29b_bin.137 TaxID=2969217 RepID=UPI002608A8F6|nr:response regulator [Acaryochloris sp. IP29b_bin.137]